MENKLEDCFGYIKEIVSELRLEAVLRLIVLKVLVIEVHGLSTNFCTIGVIDMPQDEKVVSSDVRCLKDSDFLATFLLKEEALIEIESDLNLMDL